MNECKKISFLAMCSCASLMFAYVETLLPPPILSVPGIKPGLANIMSVFVLYKYGVKSSVSVSFVRIMLSALLFGGIWSLPYGVLGAAMSIFVMSVMKKTEAFSPVGVSISGGIAHNVGQIIFAMISLNTAGIAFSIPLLVLAGTLTGALVGTVSSVMIKHLEKV